MTVPLTERQARFADLDVTTLYLLLKLRTDIFVVEQADPYGELDGRDMEQETVHLWFAQEDNPIAYLRMLREQDNSIRIGRVVVNQKERGKGIGKKLMVAALDRVNPNDKCVLSAQTTQAGFYRQFGFVESGPEYSTSRILHVPMVREPRV